uniref:BPTI/Kunitz inhibitor domain-containing protein n=1 Tax=Poecilia latipinna TaxID=48699 RepID=A0A3B3US00_9TELE
MRVIQCGFILNSSTTLTDHCLLPMSEGACSEYALVWYFHGQSGECRPFVYGGCGGNQNRFTSKQDCESLCGTKSGVTETRSALTEDLPSDS